MIINLCTILGSVEDVVVKNDSLIRFSGRVLNVQTNLPVKAKLVLEQLPYSNNIIVLNSNGETGAFQFEVSNEIKYFIEVRAEGYTTYSEIITLNNEEELNKDIYLTPTMVGQILRMNKLLFRQSTAQFYENSYEELNSLYGLLIENPTMIVQLEGHTDFRGNQKLNMKLSQDRVEAVKKYLVKQGVQKNRIRLKAFGGTLPLSKEDTEEGQTINRRVEVRILQK